MNQMTSITRDTGSTVLDRIRAIVPEIQARADEIEQGATVPLDLLERLEQAGAFRIAVPKMFGGEGLSITDAAQVIEEIAAADASVAWHLMVAAGTQVITSRLPLDSLKEFYAQGPDTWAKAAASPKGVAVPVEGGYRLSGRWPLASGARNFEWISLGFMIMGPNGPQRMPDGRPDMRVCLIPAGDVEVLPTWDAVGLRGTRSDDLIVKDRFVPEAWQASFFAPSTVAAPTLRLSMPSATAANHLAVVQGILKSALADLANDALTRKPAFAPTTVMKDDPVFCSRFGEIASRVDALIMLSCMCGDMLKRCDDEGRDVTAFERGKICSAQAFIHHDATQVMDQILMLSGSQGVYATHRQQRRWRDLRCVSQHQSANISFYSMYAGELIAKAAARAVTETAHVTAVAA